MGDRDGDALQGSDIPADFPNVAASLRRKKWISPGDAVAVKPNGAVAAGRSTGRRASLLPISTRRISRRARRSLDVCSNYTRPNILAVREPETTRACCISD